MSTKTRKRLPRAEREERMLVAAQEVFGRGGFIAGSMEEIAERSGITKALLYQYFGSKEGRYEATVERSRAELFEALRAEVDAAPPGRAKLAAFVRGYFDYVEANRGAWWLLYGEAGSAAVNAMRDRNADLIVRLLTDALGDAAKDADPDDLAVLAHALVGAGEQVGRWWAARPDVAKEVVVARFGTVASGAIDEMYRSLLRAYR